MEPLRSLDRAASDGVAHLSRLLWLLGFDSFREVNACLTRGFRKRVASTTTASYFLVDGCPTVRLVLPLSICWMRLLGAALCCAALRMLFLCDTADTASWPSKSTSGERSWNLVSLP